MKSAQILKEFSRTTEDMFSLDEFKQILESGKQLRIKYGVDVTAPTLHIGHAVNLWMMRYLQDLGHKVIFLIGDFTTRIGDPTGKSKTRPTISLSEIEENKKKFIDQAKMVLRFDNPSLLEIRYNSEWFNSMPTSDFLKVLSMVTHARLISRDMFQKRIETSEEIYMHEMIYPILQGYDSYMLKSDLTIIGSDQLFNEMLGRFYQEKLGQRQQVIITTKITPGIDGKEKQSKSLGNYVGLEHSPRDKFGRIMSMSDNLIGEYFHIYTDISLDRVKEIKDSISIDPMRYKKLLANSIVARYHGKDVADEEQKWFESTFSSRKIPDDILEVLVSEKKSSVFNLVLRFFGDKKSKTEIRRLFKHGAVSFNSEKVTDIDQSVSIHDGDVVKIGKRIWFRMKTK